MQLPSASSVAFMENFLIRGAPKKAEPEVNFDEKDLDLSICKDDDDDDPMATMSSTPSTPSKTATTTSSSHPPTAATAATSAKIPEARFQPLQPTQLTEEERREWDERVVHKPLPLAQPHEDIFHGRRRRVTFEVTANESSAASADSESKGQTTIDTFFRRLNPETTLSRCLQFDRRNPPENEDNLMLQTMADLTSNCVVFLGNDRISDSEARDYYREYLKSLNYKPDETKNKSKRRRLK